MMRRVFFRGGKLRLLGVVAAGCAITLASCGTILYPERRGQPAGQLDIGVVALDGIGLLLFLVPGIIAFAVDFGTGAIYLPPGQAAAPVEGKDYQSVRVDPADLTPERLEAVVLEKTGKTVDLRSGDYRARRVRGLDEISPEILDELRAEPAPARVRFRASRD